MKTWKVKFMRKGWEPPYPFGKSYELVKAETRQEAIEHVRDKASPRYKITASPVRPGTDGVQA